MNYAAPAFVMFREPENGKVLQLRHIQDQCKSLLGFLLYIKVDLRMSNLQRMILCGHLVMLMHPGATTQFPWHVYFSPVKCAEAAEVQRDEMQKFSVSHSNWLALICADPQDDNLEVGEVFYNTHVCLPMPDTVLPLFPECTSLQCPSTQHGLDIYQDTPWTVPWWRTFWNWMCHFQFWLRERRQLQISLYF